MSLYGRRPIPDVLKTDVELKTSSSASQQLLLGKYLEHNQKNQIISLLEYILEFKGKEGDKQGLAIQLLYDQALANIFKSKDKEVNGELSSLLRQVLGVEGGTKEQDLKLTYIQQFLLDLNKQQLDKQITSDLKTKIENLFKVAIVLKDTAESIIQSQKPLINQEAGISQPSKDLIDGLINVNSTLNSFIVALSSKTVNNIGLSSSSDHSGGMDRDAKISQAVINRAFIDEQERLVLAKVQIDAVERELTPEKFKILIDRYGLKRDELNLDGIRMLMVGAITNLHSQEWRENNFVKGVLDGLLGLKEKEPEQKLKQKEGDLEQDLGSVQTEKQKITKQLAEYSLEKQSLEESIKTRGLSAIEQIEISTRLKNLNQEIDKLKQEQNLLLQQEAALQAGLKAILDERRPKQVILPDAKKELSQEELEKLWQSIFEKFNNLWEPLIKKTDRGSQSSEQQSLEQQLIDKGGDLLLSKLYKDKYFSRIIKNENFKKDLNTILTFADISNWQVAVGKEEQTDSKQLVARGQQADSKLQKFASNEYLFHKLADLELKNDSVVPVLELNGERNFYKVRTLIDATDQTDKIKVQGFVLVPLEPQKSLDLKVIFKGDKDSLGYDNDQQLKAFKKHKATILQNLNTTIAEFKLSLQQDQKEKVSLNIGGRGGGGVFAQCLTKELVTYQAAVEYDPRSVKDGLKSLVANVGKQVAIEKDLRENLGQPPIKDELDYQEEITRRTVDHLIKTKNFVAAIVPDQLDNQLGTIKKITLTTDNGGGIPEKVRGVFIQSLYILRDKLKSTFSIECNKTIVNDDVAHKTGATDLAVGVTADLMCTNLLKIDPGNKLEKLMVNAALNGISLATKAVVKAGVAVATQGGSAVADGENSALTKVIDPLSDNARHVANNLQQIQKCVVQAYEDCFCGKKTNREVQYIPMSNDKEDVSCYQIHKELSTKSTNYSRLAKFFRFLPNLRQGKQPELSTDKLPRENPEKLPTISGEVVLDLSTAARLGSQSSFNSSFGISSSGSSLGEEAFTPRVPTPSSSSRTRDSETMNSASQAHTSVNQLLYDPSKPVYANQKIFLQSLAEIINMKSEDSMPLFSKLLQELPKENKMFLTGVIDLEEEQKTPLQLIIEQKKSLNFMEKFIGCAKENGVLPKVITIPDPNTQDSLLQVAIKAKNQNAVDSLLNLPIPDITRELLLMRGEYNNTALHTAVKANDAASVEKLLRATQGLQIKEREKIDGESITRDYINSKNSPVKIEEERETALHIAAKNNNSAIFKALLKNGAFMENSVLTAAVKHGSSEVVRWVLSKEFTSTIKHHVNLDGPLLKDLLKLSFDKNKTEIAKSLLDRVVIPKAKSTLVLLSDFFQMNPQPPISMRDLEGLLHLSVKQENIALVLALVQKGVNINAQDEAGNTIFHIAARSHNSKFFKELLEQLKENNINPNFNIKNNTSGGQRTVLHIAAALGKEGIVDELIKQKVNLMEKDQKGKTPLALAIKRAPNVADDPNGGKDDKDNQGTEANYVSIVKKLLGESQRNRKATIDELRRYSSYNQEINSEIQAKLAILQGKGSDDTTKVKVAAASKADSKNLKQQQRKDLDKSG